MRRLHLRFVSNRVTGLDGSHHYETIDFERSVEQPKLELITPTSTPPKVPDATVPTVPALPALPTLPTLPAQPTLPPVPTVNLCCCIQVNNCIIRLTSGDISEHAADVIVHSSGMYPGGASILIAVSAVTVLHWFLVLCSEHCRESQQLSNNVPGTF